MPGPPGGAGTLRRMERWLEPLHDAESMRATDAWAIDEQGVPSLELMEAAGRAVAEGAAEIAGAGPARVVCGKGNNGGDGLVAARHLAALGHEVEVLLLWPADELSADAAANLERYEGAVRELGAGEVGAALEGSGVVVDAIFGTGFSGAARDPAAAAIEAINASGAPVVAADIASGVDASSGEVEGLGVEAEITVSFHAAKLGHWIAPGKRHRGELRVAPIGIPDGAPAEAPGGLIRASVLELLDRRGAESTKFSSGQVLVAGGSRGLTGAVCMSAEAAARAGAGYATVAVPAELEQIFEIKLTEVMSIGCASADGHLTTAAADAILEAAERAAAVVLGPGLGRADEAFELVAVARRPDRGAAGDRRRRPQRARREARAARRAGRADRAHPARRRARAAARDRLRGGRRPSARRRDRGARRARRRSWSSRATTRSSPPPATGRSSTASRARRWRPRAPATCSAGWSRRCSPAGSSRATAAAAAVHAHARAGRAAAERVGAAESVIATDVIEAIPAGLRPDGDREHG